jgi:hypothetical protein
MYISGGSEAHLGGIDGLKAAFAAYGPSVLGRSDAHALLGLLQLMPHMAIIAALVGVGNTHGYGERKDREEGIQIQPHRPNNRPATTE